MPSNSGGLSLDLALYPSKPVGARLEFHRERYVRVSLTLDLTLALNPNPNPTLAPTLTPTPTPTLPLTRYDRLVEQLEKGKSAFATEQPTSKHTYDRLTLILTLP